MYSSCPLSLGYVVGRHEIIVVLNGFTDSFTQYDAWNWLVCLVAVQGLAEENEQGINENKQKNRSA